MPKGTCATSLSAKAITISPTASSENFSPPHNQVPPSAPRPIRRHLYLPSPVGELQLDHAGELAAATPRCQRVNCPQRSATSDRRTTSKSSIARRLVSHSNKSETLPRKSVSAAGRGLTLAAVLRSIHHSAGASLACRCSTPVKCWPPSPDSRPGRNSVTNSWIPAWAISASTGAGLGPPAQLRACCASQRWIAISTASRRAHHAALRSPRLEKVHVGESGSVAARTPTVFCKHDRYQDDNSA